MNLTIEGDLAKRLITLLKNDEKLARALAEQWVAKIEPAVMYQYLLDPTKVLELLSRMLQKHPEQTIEDLQGLAEGKKPVARKAPAQKAPRRKPGRPRKTTAEKAAATKAPRKKPGRPRKTTAEKAAAKKAPRKKPGRPRKIAAKKAPAQKAPAKKAPAKKAPARKVAARKAPATGTRRRRFSPEEVNQAKDKIRTYLGSHQWATRKELSTAGEIPTQAIYRRIITELRTSGELISKGQKSKAVYGLKSAGKAKKPKGRKKARSK